MKLAYTEHANICAKFYALTLDSKLASDFVFQKSKALPGEKALFVGGMFEVASELIKKGLDVTVIDYSAEMVELGSKDLPQARVLKADLSALSFQNEFDLVLVVGRVFTHMISDENLSSAIDGCKRALRAKGRLFADNYEDSRIQKTNYFNGTINCGDSNCAILRDSKTTRLTSSPFVIRWDAKYSGNYNGKSFEFSDSMEHRAFSRNEFARYIKSGGLQVVTQGDNFDETSFYTLAQV